MLFLYIYLVVDGISMTLYLEQCWSFKNVKVNSLLAVREKIGNGNVIRKLLIPLIRIVVTNLMQRCTGSIILSQMGQNLATF